jgi:hypothetical protein
VRTLKTFRYRPEFAAGFERSRIVELSIALVFVGGVGAAFIWAAFTNLNEYFGLFAIGVTVAMVALVLYKSLPIFRSLSKQATTSLTLDGTQLAQFDSAGHVLGTIDLAADFARSTTPFVFGERQFMTLRQREQVVEFNSEIEGRRELIVAILAKQFGISTDSTDHDHDDADADDEAPSLTLRFVYQPEAGEYLERVSRRVRYGCVLIGAPFFALLALAFIRGGQSVPAFIVAVVGLLVVGLFLSVVRISTESRLQRTNYITFTSPQRLRSHGETGAPLGTIDLDAPYDFRYFNTQLRLTQDDQVVEFERDLDGAEELTTWIIGHPFRDPSS